MFASRWFKVLATGFGLFVLYLLIQPAVLMQWRSAQGERLRKQLARIGEAIHAYHEREKSFPPTWVNGPDGKPWHSWRTLIFRI